MTTNNDEPKTYIICSGDNSGNIETLDYRCPKEGIKKGDCRINGRTCEYFLGRIKGFCEYILNNFK